MVTINQSNVSFPMKNAPGVRLGLVVFIVVLAATLTAARHLDDGVRAETRVDEARAAFGVTGQGVLIAILDRGIDYEHPDFRNADGTSRIHYIFDLTDDTGAAAPGNTYGVGTLYAKADIDAALAGGNRLATRDAVGHGTTTAGLAGGNGRASGGLYAGMAPDAGFIIVKFTSDGAPAHDGEPAEDPFFDPSRFPTALDFVLEKADALAMPVVALANFGSIGAMADGTSAFARAVDERFGPGRPGRVFVNGTSDDGGRPNHAAGTISQDETIDLEIRKGNAGNLRLEFWYDGADRFDVEVVTPSGTSGPYAAPATNADRDTQQTAGFLYTHNGSDVDFWGVASNTREILIDFGGPVGDYVVRLTGASVTDGSFHATLSPANIFSGTDNQFESFVVPGYTVWDMASAQHNITPNSYVLRTQYTDVDGILRTVNDEGEVGDLWLGSGVGPTFDERLGVTVSAPGERLFAPYAPRSIFATSRGNVIQDDGQGGMYGIQSAVSAAAPVTTGIIALMLEAGPTLDAAEVKDILQRTARTDAFTGETPNPRWGYGKIDAFAAIAEVLGVTAIETVSTEVPGRYTLAQNYPNPFNPETRIGFDLPVSGEVRLAVFDVLGREVAVLVDERLPAGRYEAVFAADDLPSGVYVYQLEAGGRMLTHTMLLLK